MTEFTKNVFKGSTIASLQIFRILIDMSSWPWALSISKNLIVFRISLPVVVIDSRQEAVRNNLLGSTELNKWRTLQAKKLIEIISFF